MLSLEQIKRAREAVREVYMDEKIEKYILDIIFATRYPEKFNLPKLKDLIRIEKMSINSDDTYNIEIDVYGYEK